MLKPQETKCASPSTTIPAMGSSADTVLTFRTSLHEFGRQAALASGDTRVNKEQLASLEEQAEAMAREQAATIFDPTQSQHDEEKRQEADKAKARSVEIADQVKLAEDDVRKRCDAVAELGEPPTKPAVPWLLFFFGTLLIALSVAPTLHDFFFVDFEDPRQAWFLSFICGLAAGLFVSWSLLGTYTIGKAYHWMGLAAGLVFGLALLLIRLTGVESSLSLMMAIGLALLEVAVVIAMHWAGDGFRDAFAEYTEKVNGQTCRRAYLAAGERELAYRKEELAKQQQIVSDYVAHLRERETLARQVEGLVRGSRQTVKAGYFAGLAENEGAVRGRKRSQP